jgi:hypothetical protein
MNYQKNIVCLMNKALVGCLQKKLLKNSQTEYLNHKQLMALIMIKWDKFGEKKIY